MTEEDKKFATHLVSTTKTHADWLIAIRYGWETVRRDTAFLMQLAVDESRRMTEQPNNTAHQADHLATICVELKIKFTVEPTVNTR